MKKSSLRKVFVLFVFFSSILMFGKAQNYIPMVKADAQYNYFDTYAGPPPHYSKLYTFSKDTTINSNQYKRLDVSFDSINWQHSHYFFYEDTIEERVYLFYNDTIGLLYDFSLSTGDTVEVYNPAFGTSAHQLIVNAVDSILLLGNYHKTLTFNNHYWIEGIGDVHGIMSSGSELTGVSETLICYHLQEILFYQNNLYSNCFFLSNAVNKHNSIDIKISTNNNIYTINSSLMIYKYDVFSVMGASILNGVANNKKISINLSNENSGLYLLNLIFENNASKTLKIIKF